MKEVQLDLGAYASQETAPGLGCWRYERPLPLRTDGRLRVVATGIGAAFSLNMRQSNFILIKGETAVFVDLGMQASRRLAEFGVSCHDIEHLIVTHSHADHMGSLEELALKRRYEAPLFEVPREKAETDRSYAVRLAAARQTGRFRPKLYVPDFYARELWDYSLRGGLMFSEEVEAKGPEGGMKLEHFFEVIQPRERDDDIYSWEVEIGGIHILTFVTKHVPDALSKGAKRMYTVGMVVDHRLYISGDTQFDPTPIKHFGKDCEALWHDAQHFKGGVHAWYGDLQRLPDSVKERMHLYHLSEGMLDIDVEADGFAGFLRPAPTVYDFD